MPGTVKTDNDVGGLKLVFANTLDDAPGLLVASGPALLYSVHLVNTTAALAYIQVFDLAALSSVTLGTTVADYVFVLPSGANTGQFDMDLAKPVVFKNGIVVFSTTTATGLTAAISHGVFAYA